MSDGLGEAGKNLWDDVSKGRELSTAHKALLLNACRVADRLDEIERELPTGILTVENHLGTVSVHPLIPEQRQQLAQLSAILTRLGYKELPRETSKKTVKDQMAEQRAKREAKKGA